jgi:hypothetical protein
MAMADDGIRTWYGRMYLPPANAVQHARGQPFGRWRAHHAAHPTDIFTAARANATTVEATRRALSEGASPASQPLLPSGCGGGRRYLSTTGASSCLQNQIYCWHQCIAVDALPCTTAAVCWRHADSSIWTEEDEHCGSCEAMCLHAPPLPPTEASPSPPAPYVEPFCTGAGTDMHMRGFVLHKSDCVILLFREWKLDAAWKFALGVLGTFSLGIFTELLTWSRRHVISGSAAMRRRPAAYRMSMGLAFTVQCAIGYLLMLAAMTYQAELFIAVVCGLGLGHLLFNTSQPVGETVDACCVDTVATSTGPSPKSRTVSEATSKDRF